jgi:hypothetical protein
MSTKTKRKARSTMADVRRAKAAFGEHRDRKEVAGMEVCLVVVGYVSGRDPFRLLGRVSADLGEDAMPDPPLTMAEMQPVAFAAKMALAKVLAARRKVCARNYAEGARCARKRDHSGSCSQRPDGR